MKCSMWVTSGAPFSEGVAEGTLTSLCPDLVDRVRVNVVADLVAEMIFLRVFFFFLYGLRGDSGPRVDVDERVAGLVSSDNGAGNSFL